MSKQKLPNEKEINDFVGKVLDSYFKKTFGSIEKIVRVEKNKGHFWEPEFHGVDKKGKIIVFFGPDFAENVFGIKE